ncbi:helix-turn-helix transcriptional regulator [Streptomyces sp. NPDC057011]|uniref:helix-turn-helix transcriptional regulator n=1 Tax=unclassified Streptomyces TaxID=2593676 RepID=UPI0036414FDE
MSTYGAEWSLVSARPDRRLRAGVLGYRGYRMALDRPRRRLELPDGVVTLVLGFQGQLRLTDVGRPDGTTAARAGEPAAVPFTSLVSAVRSRATIGEHSGILHGMEVLLAPWAAYNLLGVEMHEWADRILDPAELVGRRVDDLAGALAALPSWRRRFELLDATLAQWSAAGPPCSARVVWAWGELSRTGGAVPIRHLAEQSGWSWRQFESRFRQQIGMPPKTIARIMRLHRALRLLGSGQAVSQAALACGFSDQSHLAREVRRMTGRTATQLLAAPAGTAAGPPADDRVEGRMTSVLLPDRTPPSGGGRK